MKKGLINTIAMLGLASASPNAMASLLVYEPFNYPVGSLTGVNGGTGFASGWVASTGANNAGRVWDQTTNVLYDGSTLNWNGVLNNGFPELPLTGSRYLAPDNTTPGSNLDVSRPLASSAGAMAASNGGVLWMSAVYHFENRGLGAGMTIGLGNGYINNRGRAFQATTTDYIGVNGSTSATTANFRLNAMVTEEGWAAGKFALTAGSVALPTTTTTDLIVLLKYTFGASDTVEAAFFTEDTLLSDITEANFNSSPNKVTATYATGIDENGLNVLTISQGRFNNAMDEVRIGTTFASVVTLPPAGPVDIAMSTVTATPSAVPADGTTTSTVTVTLTDSLGVPVAGKDVSVANTSGPMAAVITPPGTQTTNASGQVTFTVKSGTGGTEVFTATNATDTQVITQTASVIFVSSADAGLSSVVASPIHVAADGVSTSTVTVTLLAEGSTPVAGKSVTLAGNTGNAVISPSSQTSNASGVATFTVKSNVPGTEVFTATVTTDSVVVTQTAGVNFVGPVSAGLSTVASSLSAVVANGSLTSTITVSLKDANGFPVEGKNITLTNTAGPQAATINPPGAQVTNASGVATFTVSSTTVGTEVFTATNTTDSLVLTQTASVQFIDPAVPLAFNVSFVQFTPTLGDFEDPATLVGPAGGSGETWNQIRAVSGTNFLASSGAATAVGVTTTFTECRQRSTSGLALLYDALTDFGKGLSPTVTISGLVPGSLYNLWIASTVTSPDPSERANGTFSTTNTTSTVGAQLIDQSVAANTTTWEQGNNYVLLENVVVNGSGQIVLTAASTAGYRLPLSGFQLKPVGKALITTFGLPGNPGVIDQNAKTIALTVPYGTNLSTLAPTFGISSGVCNQTSGAPPSPTFAAQNPATYTVTDDSTDPDTVNNYTVTVTVETATTTLVIDLGTSPAGTAIAGGSFIGTGPTNLPLPSLPPGSILRSIAINSKLEATNNENFASDLSLLLDPTPESPGAGFSVEITNGTTPFGGTVSLDWPVSSNNGVGTDLIDTQTEAAWAAVAPIDLATTLLFLGNAYGGPIVGGTWSGTITLTYDLVGGGSPYDTWSGGASADIDSNGDGVDNGVAWALGAADPNANAIGLLPSLDNTSDANYVIFEFNRSDVANGDANTGIAVEYGNDLAGWTTAVDDNNNVEIEVIDGSPTDEVRVKLKRSTLGSGGKIFARLKVVVTTP